MAYGFIKGKDNLNVLFFDHPSYFQQALFKKSIKGRQK
jgi:hypothetical protein